MPRLRELSPARYHADPTSLNEFRFQIGMTIDLLEFIGLVITGFTSCAEFGSYAFVHPVIPGLPRQHNFSVDKGLLKTFGPVMPVLLTLFSLVPFAYSIRLHAAHAI